MLLVNVFVEFDPWGRMGNRMFQYAFAYILASKRNTRLYTNGLHNFNIPNTLGLTPVNPIYTRSYGDNNVNMHELFNTKRDVVVNSFVQKSCYYLPFRNELKEIFNVSPCIQEYDDTLVIHVRETDYVQINQFLGYDYYRKLIDFSGFKDVVIVTDNSECETVKRLVKDGCRIHSEGIVKDFNTTNDVRAMNDFNKLLRSDNIAISQSSFSWWAAFLGDHSNIIFPYKKIGGQWLLEPGPDNSDLYFDSPASVKYIDNH